MCIFALPVVRSSNRQTVFTMDAAVRMQADGHAEATDAGRIRGDMERSESQVNSMSADIRESADAIGQLAQQVSDIGQVIQVISAISEQTNLLALNAAIEAARAGEHVLERRPTH